MKEVKIFDGIAKVWLQGFDDLEKPGSGLIQWKDNKFTVGNNEDLMVELIGFDLENITIGKLMMFHKVELFTTATKARTWVKITRLNGKEKSDKMLYLGTIDDGTYPTLDEVFLDIRPFPNGTDEEFCFISLNNYR